MDDADARLTAAGELTIEELSQLSDEQITDHVRRIGHLVAELEHLRRERRDESPAG